MPLATNSPHIFRQYSGGRNLMVEFRIVIASEIAFEINRRIENTIY
jgi:hypothetical protein